MNNVLYMTDEFERQKKIKASSITFGVAGVLLLILILIKWPNPVVAPPVEEAGIEVNLGSSDFGSGTDQPMLPGQPAPQEAEAYTPPKQVRVTQNEARDIETDDRNTDAPAISKPAVSNPKATQINTETKVVKTNPAPVTEQTPAPPKPKATMNGVRGGTGNGGNDASTYERGGNEGIAGGTGDQGRPGGTPGSPNYSGNPGRGGGGGPRVTRGDRKIVRYYSFQGELPAAVVYAEIKVSPDGRGHFVQLAKGSTNTGQAYKNAITQYLQNIRFDVSDHESTVNVQFNFKVSN
ncbi:MAG TPA: hypothetical protein VM187_06190 [Niastella sp.]|nr:hypothetical protein [Niastella sp.]